MELEDGESVEVQGSGSARYLLRNVGEVYSCSCPAWRNQSLAIERRTCKHLKALRGEAVEQMDRRTCGHHPGLTVSRDIITRYRNSRYFVNALGRGIGEEPLVTQFA